MPRNTVKIKSKVEYLSILDGAGHLDKALDPQLDAELSVYIYRLMLMARRLDERCINLQRQGRIGTFAPCRGQEAAHCASSIMMDEDDWIVYAFREPGAQYHRGWALETILKNWGGYEEGSAPPEGVNDLPIAVPIATQTLHAMGLAWAMKLRGDNHAVLCYCGDGGTSEGDFHEALNFAGVYRLPVVFVVQNNHWAISVPREAQTASETIAQKALAYGFDGLQLDGNDPLAVYVGTKEAVNLAKSGGGPTLIEAVTYRLAAHTTADDPTKYRKQEEFEKWEKLDPIPRYEKYLVDRRILDEKLVGEIDREVKAEIAAAVELFEASQDVDPADCFKYLYAELPPELVEQREEFTAALAREGIGRGSSAQAGQTSRPRRARPEGKSISPDLPKLGIGESRVREAAWRR